MCGTCGCGESPAGSGLDPHAHQEQRHHPEAGHPSAAGDSLHAAPTLGAAHAHGVDPARIFRIERDLLLENDRHAAAIRARLAAAGVFAVNLVSSPGSGKTTLLERTIRDLSRETRIAVIEGDQHTQRDAERIRAAGADALQINTGKGCHLDAHRVRHALDQIATPPGTLLFIENVGNLVCPAAFDLGENRRALLLSVTEGEDKPLKYQDLFASAATLVLTKTDLLPHVEFAVERCIEYARRARPDVEILAVSARTGAGLDDWYRWLARGVSAARKAADACAGSARDQRSGRAVPAGR